MAPIHAVHDVLIRLVSCNNRPRESSMQQISVDYFMQLLRILRHFYNNL